MTKVSIIDGTATCPCGCGHTFAVRQHASIGAQSAKYLEKLSSKQEKILKWWRSKYPENQESYTKRELYTKYTAYTPITFGSFEARISELLGTGLIRISVEQEKDAPDNTTRAPKYELDYVEISRWDLNGEKNPNLVKV